MIRFFISLGLGLLLGVAFGLTLGWGVFPTRTVGNPAVLLSQEYKDAYTVMIAAGFRADGDINGALERLEILRTPDIPLHVRQVTERYINNSRRLDDIYHLVALSAALGVLTDQMRPYQQIIAP